MPDPFPTHGGPHCPSLARDAHHRNLPARSALIRSWPSRIRTAVDPAIQRRQTRPRGQMGDVPQVGEGRPLKLGKGRKRSPSQGSKGCDLVPLPYSLSDLVDNRLMTYTLVSSVGKPDEVMSILRAGMEPNPFRSVYLLTHCFLISSLYLHIVSSSHNLKPKNSKRIRSRHSTSSPSPSRAGTGTIIST